MRNILTLLLYKLFLDFTKTFCKKYEQEHIVRNKSIYLDEIEITVEENRNCLLRTMNILDMSTELSS